MPAMALLDRNGVYGAARFHTSAKRNDIRAHIGAEISVSSFIPRLTPPAWLLHQHITEPARLPLLCESREGYQNLCQLLTQFKMREKTKGEGAATTDDLRQYASGIICLTGGDEGPLAAALVHGGEEAGRETVEQLIHIFGRKNVYVELQRHNEREEEWRNQTAFRIAQSLKLPVLATNGVRYSSAYDREIVDIFTAIRHHMDLDHAGRLLAMNSQRHLRSAKEMAALFRDIPASVENTVELSSRLQFKLNDLGYEFPHYPVPDDETMATFLKKRVAEGVIKRYGPKKNKGLLERAKRQTEHELALIETLGFAGYFLIVWDIVRFCKINDIMIQGRGSAANSAVCYALEITAIDPVGMDLLFERFLSENRGEWPDIDLDLPSDDKREQAIQYVYRRYGELGAAMTANVITYRGKSAAREVGKALGFDEESLGRLSGLVGQWEWRNKNETMAHSFHHAGFDIHHPRIAKYIELCTRIQDIPRHLGQHSGGMVICKGKLNCIVPLERASMPGRTVVQWDKEDCADLGIIKVDLLGLGMMAVLQDCQELISKHYGETVDLAQLPEDDPEVYRVLRRADTVGMFQIESRAQMASLPRNNPKEFYDLIVQVAIIRPGPIVGNMMNPYMRRRQNKEKVTYPHPSLEPVLKRTLGVPLFQEQLLRMAMAVANFSGAEAEELRRAVGMRRSWERMKTLEVKLRKGMTANGIDIPVQDNIVENISSFALYGFPESHAASFALLAYASAYFKVKYLGAFTCAILNNQPMGFYMPAVLVKDAQRHGLRIKPIDIHTSDWTCTIEQEKDKTLSVRLGLNYARGLRSQSAQAIVESRTQNGPFCSAEDLAQRVSALNKRELILLAQIGALNHLNGIAHRRDALWQVERASKLEGPLLRQNRECLQNLEMRPLQQMNTDERLVADYAGTGLTVGKHPMHYRRRELQLQGVLSAADLQTRKDGEWVRMAGCIIARQRPGTAKGFIFLSVEDETGIANVIVTPDLYERDRLLVTRSKFIWAEGRLQNQDGVIHIKAIHMAELSDKALKLRSHDFH